MRLRTSGPRPHQGAHVRIRRPAVSDRADPLGVRHVRCLCGWWPGAFDEARWGFPEHGEGQRRRPSKPLVRGIAGIIAGGRACARLCVRPRRRFADVAADRTLPVARCARCGASEYREGGFMIPFASTRRILARIVTFGITSALVLSLIASLGTVGDAGSSNKSKSGKLGLHGLELLAAARASGESTTTLLVAAPSSQTRGVAVAIEKLGGTVRYRDDDLDYLRVTIAIDRAEDVAVLNGIDAVEVDEILPLPDPRPGEEANAQTAPTPYPAPDARTPRDNPYLPIRDTGAAAFTAAYPEWDGRGVTVGILDTGVTLDHPALSTTTVGTPKVIDWVTYTDPFTDNDPTWVPVTTAVTGPTFTIGTGTSAVTYAAPSASSFRFGNFNERDSRLGGEVGSDA